MLLNIVSATCIVFANKLVLSVYKFHFVYALTLIHTVTTMVSLHTCSVCYCIAGDNRCYCCVPAIYVICAGMHMDTLSWQCAEA